MKKLTLIVCFIAFQYCWSLDFFVTQSDDLSIKTEQIKHTAWHGAFAYEYGIPLYTIFSLTKEQTIDVVPRIDSFKKDPQSHINPIAKDDYKNSGYDKGHMVDCDSLRYSDTAMKESFYMTNMCPQLPSFNRRGVWRTVEQLVETLAIQYGKVYVITGPVLIQPLEEMESLQNKGKVYIPNSFFKVVFVCNDRDELLCINYFLFPNQAYNNIVNTYDGLDTFTTDTGLIITWQ